MDALKILIVEDETITALDISETLVEAGHTVTAIARTFGEAMEAVKRSRPDLALIDIHLEGTSADGITTAKALLAQYKLPIIYLTANSEYQTFQAAKETLPFAYLLKPFRHDELKLQVELAHHYFRAKQTQTADSTASDKLYLPTGKGYEKIDPDQVLYLKADGAYVKIFVLAKESPYYISANLGHLSQYFATPNFYRLSRSVLINLNHIERLEHNNLYMVDHKLPVLIPAANRKELLGKLTVVRTK